MNTVLTYYRTLWNMVRITVSSLQVRCDGCALTPLETRIQPIQASPCAQDLRCVTVHTFLFNRFPNMLVSPLDFSAR